MNLNKEKIVVDNQHKKITGYRDLSEEEIALMNEGKELSVRVGEYIDNLENHEKLALDRRWLSIGKTHLQQGFMATIRSIAKPTTF